MDSPWINVAIALLGLTLLVIHGCHGLSYKMQSDEEKLLDYLFQDYNPSARPVLNSSKTVNVDIQFSLLQIQELNVRNQVLTSTGLLILDWMDERLTWDKEISFLDEMVINSKHIWKPEFAVINGAEGIYEDYSEFQAVLYPNGRIHWEPGGVFKTMCQIDITYYPFDEQKCDLVFGAWSYYTSKMNLTTNVTTVNLDTYESNGEWHLLGTYVVRKEFFFECCPDQLFSNVAFGISIRRRHTFYIMNVILPGILTSAVLLSIFFCTPSQKVHIGVAALLSFRLFLLNVADTIPRTSDHVPLLGIYLTCTMAITTSAMVATVFVLNLYGMKEKPVPIWAKRVFITYLARVLCMCNCLAPGDSVEDGLHPKLKYKLVHTTEPLPSHENGEPGEISEPLVSYRNNSSSRPHPQTPHLNIFENAKKDSRKPVGKPDYGKDWVHVAAVCDRLFFWLCLTFIVITTLMLFHPLTTSRYFKIPMIEKNKDEEGL